MLKLRGKREFKKNIKKIDKIMEIDYQNKNILGIFITSYLKSMTKLEKKELKILKKCKKNFILCIIKNDYLVKFIQIY